jgi:hypothetical protein
MQTKKQELARKNMYMSQDVARWYEEEAERIGVSQSALMTTVLSNYIDQKKSMDMGETLKELLKHVEEKE